MALTDARVKFLRGLQANLPVALTDGNVYIATDERAMYVDYHDGTNVQRIRIGDILEYNTMTDIRALPTTSLSTSALYYAKNDNILCKWTGTAWRQINAQKELDDYISSIAHTVSLSSDIATVGLIFKNDQNVTVKSTDFKLETLDNAALKLAIDSASRKVTLRARNVTASIDAAVAADGTITFSNVYTGTDSSGSAVNSTTTGPVIKITHATTGGVQVTGNATTGVITINSDYRIVGASANSSKSLDVGLTNINSAGVVVEESKMRLTPKIVVGDSNTTVNHSNSVTVDATVSYTANTKEAVVTLNLPVYTKKQIDDMISTELKNLNSMTFKGNIKATGGTVTAPPLTDNTVKVGDTYIVADDSGNYNINTGGTKQAAIKGDLFIATSTNATTPENTLGYIDRDDIKWVYVPSGDDAQHEYALAKAMTAQTNGIPYIYLKNEANVMVGNGVGFGTGLETEDTTVSGNTVTVVKHKTYSAASATAGTAVSLSQNAANSTLSGSITAITGLTMENGHVTGYTTQQFSVALTEAITESRFTNSISSNVATLKAEVKNSAGVWLTATGMTLSSNSLTFTRTSAAAMNVDMLWETF